MCCLCLPTSRITFLDAVLVTLFSASHCINSPAAKVNRLPYEAQNNKQSSNTDRLLMRREESADVITGDRRNSHGMFGEGIQWNVPVPTLDLDEAALINRKQANSINITHQRKEESPSRQIESVDVTREDQWNSEGMPDKHTHGLRWWRRPDPALGLVDGTRAHRGKELDTVGQLRKQANYGARFSSCQVYFSSERKQLQSTVGMSIDSLKLFWNSKDDHDRFDKSMFLHRKVPDFWDYGYSTVNNLSRLACNSIDGCDTLLEHIGNAAPSTKIQASAEITPWQRNLWSMSILPGNEVIDGPFSDCRGHGSTHNSLEDICKKPVICKEMIPFAKASEVKGVIQSANESVLVTLRGDQNIVDTERLHHHGNLAGKPFGEETDERESNKPTKEWADILSFPGLKMWFMQNMFADHHKLAPFPIGLMACGGKAEKFISVREKMRSKDVMRKTHHLLVNHGAFQSTCIREQLLLKARTVWDFATVIPPVVMQLAANPELGRFKADEAYMHMLSRFRFVVSPPGAGWDCYRTWEALYVGTIPIIIKSGTPFDKLYDDLPVLLVNNLNEITLELLENTWAKYSSWDFKLSKLLAKYWSRVVNSTAEK